MLGKKLSRPQKSAGVRLFFAGTGRTLLVLVVSLIWSATSGASEAAIEGYSPVSYFTEGKAEKGSAEFSVTHENRTYYLTSAEQIRVFYENPGRYKPRHEVCSYSLSEGVIMPLDPLNFKVVGDYLLLFHKSTGKDGLEGWHSSPLSDEELLERADSQVTLLKF